MKLKSDVPCTVWDSLCRREVSSRIGSFCSYANCEEFRPIKKMGNNNISIVNSNINTLYNCFHENQDDFPSYSFIENRRLTCP